MPGAFLGAGCDVFVLWHEHMKILPNLLPRDIRSQGRQVRGSLHLGDLFVGERGFSVVDDECPASHDFRLLRQLDSGVGIAHDGDQEIEKHHCLDHHVQPEPHRRQPRQIPSRMIHLSVRELRRVQRGIYLEVKVTQDGVEQRLKAASQRTESFIWVIT